MLTTTFSDLRNNARKYFDAVEAGEVIEVYRHGKPVAVLSPYVPTAPNRWKESKPLDLKGISASRIILEEREG